MSIIKFYQDKLSSNTRYWSQSLTTSIRFEPLPNRDTGILYEVESGSKFTYSLTTVQSSVIIETPYFKDKFFIATSPLGFNIHEIKDRNVYLKFIDEFWVDHQEVIGAILGYLILNQNNEREFTSEQLAKAVENSFASNIPWRDLLSITERMMGMLSEDGSVGEGMRLGQLCISANKETRVRLEENRYVFVAH
ncbi:MAG: hypothetical protein ACKVOQ_06260 [Cyclobacteriaceae bacterium]